MPRRQLRHSPPAVSSCLPRGARAWLLSDHEKYVWSAWIERAGLDWSGRKETITMSCCCWLIHIFIFYFLFLFFLFCFRCCGILRLFLLRARARVCVCVDVAIWCCHTHLRTNSTSSCQRACFMRVPSPLIYYLTAPTHKRSNNRHPLNLLFGPHLSTQLVAGVAFNFVF